MRKLTQLRRLVLPPDAGDRGIANLADLVLLEELFLTHSNLSDEGLGALAKLKQLAYLGLAATDITDAGIPRRRLQRLREVDLRCTRVGDEGILVLAALENLSVLEVDASLVSAMVRKRRAGETTPTAGRSRALTSPGPKSRQFVALRLAGGQVELDADGRAIEAELTPTRDDAKLRRNSRPFPASPRLSSLDVTGVELSGATLASLLPPTGNSKNFASKIPTKYSAI